MVLDICLGGLAHCGVGLDRIVQVAQALSNCIGIEHTQSLAAINAKEN